MKCPAFTFVKSFNILLMSFSYVYLKLLNLRNKQTLLNDIKQSFIKKLKCYWGFNAVKCSFIWFIEKSVYTGSEIFSIERLLLCYLPNNLESSFIFPIICKCY